MNYRASMSSATDLDIAVDLAQQAGRLLLDIRSEVGPVAEDDKAGLKALRDRGDREAHELITSALARLRPDDAVLSEEGKDDKGRLGAERVWIVDPLDGTREYGQGRSDCAVHIALYDMASRTLDLGVVDLFAQGLTRTSADTAGLPPIPTDRPLRVVASRTRPPKNMDAIVSRWGELTGREVELVDVGSVGAKVNEIISGRAEAYLHNTGFYEWDLAAPHAVAAHHGLELTHWDGQHVTYNHMPPYVRDAFVSRPEVAEHLRAALSAQ